MPDPQASDADLPQNFIDWYVDPLARTVSVDPAFGTMPLHLKHEDDFDWRLRFKVGGVASTNPPMQLSQLTEIKFVLLEKGRYDGTPLATGAADPAWDQGNACYHMAVSLNAAALAAYLTTLDATSTGFSTGGFDCATAAAKAAGTTTTTATTTGTTGSTSTSTTAPGTPAATALTDYEFMAEFRWVQAGKQMRSQTFSLFIARDLLTNATTTVVIAPPAPPTDWRFLCTLASEGSPFSGEIFGYVKAPLQLEVLGLQVALQQPDPANGFRIQLTDRTGTPLNAGMQYFGDLPAHTAFAQLLFGQVLPMNQGDEVRATILNYNGNFADDSVVAAGLTVNLICRQYLTNSPAGPSGPPGITSAQATTLPSGSAATASVSGQVLTVGLPVGAKGDAGTSITQVTITQLVVGAAPTANLTGTTLNLGFPAPAPGAPGNAGTSVTSAQVTPLAFGAQPTAKITNGTLFLGIPAGAKGDAGPAPFGSVGATTVAPNTAATAAIVANVLQLGIPAGATGSYLHTASGPNVVYAANAAGTSVLSCEFTGVGKPAIVLITFNNADDQTFNQSDVFYRVSRTDGTVLYDGQQTLAHAGNTYPVSFMCLDGQTATTKQTYTLTVHAQTAGNTSSPTPVPGTVRTPVMAILEIVN